MARADLPPQELLRRLFDYDAETGNLIHRSRALDLFPNERVGASWNARYTGVVAGTPLKSGYVSVIVNYRHFLAHRLVWKRAYGSDPDFIDHIDGVRSNNRIENLRDVSRSTNGKNAALRSDNTSGCPGVYWDRRRQVWYSRVSWNMRELQIGRFANLADAVAARKAAEKQYGYHPNHGR